MKYTFVLFLLMMIAPTFLEAQDWPNFARYKDDNAKIGLPAANEKRVVFMGDSITDGWITTSPEFFAGRPYIDRGISGQTTPQMLVRFRADVIALRPKVVVILAGTNDIAGNTGPSTPEMIEDNITSMAVLAKAAHIKVILSSVLPAYDYPWRPGQQPAEKIATLHLHPRSLPGQRGQRRRRRPGADADLLRRPRRPPDGGQLHPFGVVPGQVHRIAPRHRGRVAHRRGLHHRRRHRRSALEADRGRPRRAEPLQRHLARGAVRHHHPARLRGRCR